MSAEIIENRQMIDLTGIDSDDEDDEVVFLGLQRPPRPPTPPVQPAPVIQQHHQQHYNPPGAWVDLPQQAHDQHVLVISDDEDELEELVVDRLIPPQPHPPNHLPRRPDPLRIFSPPAQFRQEPPRDHEPFYRQATPYPNAPLPPQMPPVPPPPRPRIGLGGGFIAFRQGARPAHPRNNSNANNHNNDRHNLLPAPNWIRDLFLHNVEPVQRPIVEVPIPAWGGMVWDAGRNEAIGGPVDYQPWHIAGDERLDPPKESYHPFMTHLREKPRPGFTWDFEPTTTSENAPIVIDVDETPSASSSAAVAVATPSLVCARCHQTLRMGSKTMWGLRCGHVVCGECGEYLSKPIEGKGKGKAAEEDPPAPPARAIKGKGKGKAKALPQDGAGTGAAQPSRRTRSKTASLRASTQQASAESSVGPSGSSSSNQVKVGPTTTLKRKHGKKNDTKPLLLEEYEYACPVEGCFRLHFSEKWRQPKRVSKEREDGIVEMEVVWKPKTNLGAIPIFT